MANDRLRAAMRNAGLEIEQLADLIEVDQKTVNRWLTGRNPYSRHRTRVAKALGVNELELWPDATSAETAPISSGGLELVGAFARSDDPLAPGLANTAQRGRRADRPARVSVLPCKLTI